MLLATLEDSRIQNLAPPARLPAIQCQKYNAAIPIDTPHYERKAKPAATEDRSWLELDAARLARSRSLSYGRVTAASPQRNGEETRVSFHHGASLACRRINACVRVDR